MTQQYFNARRATNQQRETMLKFVEDNPELGNDKLASQFDTFHKHQKWVELTRILNKLPGQFRTTARWVKAWQDWRYNTRKKSLQKGAKLTALEKRVMKLLNNDQDSTTIASPPSPMQVKIEPPEMEEEVDVEGNFAQENIKIEIVEHKIPDVDENQIASPRRVPVRKFQRRQSRSRKAPSDITAHQVVDALTSLCAVQKEHTAKLCQLLHKNTQALQSLAESQMRQTETLERQVSLNESQNSLLKMIADSLNALKKI